MKDGAESAAIARTLEGTGWNRKAAASELQISYKALLYKIKQYNLVPPQKTVQSRPATESMTASAGQPDIPRPEKVVVQFGSRTIKGYLDAPVWKTMEEMLSHAPQSSPESVQGSRYSNQMPLKRCRPKR